MKLQNGYILHHDIENHVVVIATGITEPSENSKTGPMIQIWILRDDMSPIDAIKTGSDESICFDCPHRGDRATGRKRSCYVNVGQAPSAVYAAFRRGSYSFLPIDQYELVFTGREVRLGAYGDPYCIPESKVAHICSLASRHTGYSHQWRRAEWLRKFVMASCDTRADFIQAQHHGWRTFRVAASLDAQPLEILCPASEEAGHKTQCYKCGLCNGAGAAKSIFIPVHGSGKSNAFAILQ
jgi:hypothetical protein